MLQVVEDVRYTMLCFLFVFIPIGPGWCNKYSAVKKLKFLHRFFLKQCLHQSKQSEAKQSVVKWSLLITSVTWSNENRH